MSQWPLIVETKPGDVPRFVRIARAFIDDIRRGRLVPGQRLPGSRALAVQLGVHRNTVLAALQDLVAQGWLCTTPAKGTFVSPQLPDSELAPPHRGWPSFAFPLPTVPPERGVPPPGLLWLSNGAPDLRLAPVDALARAWRRVVTRQGHRLLGYGHPAGHPGLRRGLADMVAHVRGLPASPENVLVTRGSQMAIDLCARALLRPGDVVAVEALGYWPAWQALRLSGARLLPIPVDGEGLDVEALARAAERGGVRAVYLTPHHQYPTTVTLSAPRRLKLLELARAHRFTILEDDYDHEFHYDGQPVLPLASADTAGVVVYVGTLSKVLAPGLRLGFIVAPADLVSRLTQLRAVVDTQGDHCLEAAVNELLEDGELQRHIRKMRTTYLARREGLVDALRAELSQHFTFDVPRGGISVWLRATRPQRFARWLSACRERGLWLAPPDAYAFDRQSVAATRVVFSRFTPAELRRAARVMGEAWRALG